MRGSTMFCSACGQQNTDDATFCTKCGKQITTSTTAQPSSPIAAPVYVSSELKESGTVTAMSVVGFVFGLIGMMGSFIPCLGSLAFYIGIPAALISAVALGIAYSQNTKKTFAIVAVTISLIGAVISGWQYFSIVAAGNKAKQELNQMFNQPRNEKRTSTSSADDSLANKFCGVWEYNENGAKNYLKITKVNSGRFKLVKGYPYEGAIHWQGSDIEIKNADGIYLTSSNGKLIGEFNSTNFYATHGMEFTYKITLDSKSDNKLLYSVYSSIRGETDEREAIKSVAN